MINSNDTLKKSLQIFTLKFKTMKELKKMNLSELKKLSRAEMQTIMAGSGTAPGCTGSGKMPNVYPCCDGLWARCGGYCC